MANSQIAIDWTDGFMSPTTNSVRNAARALLIREGRVLLLRKEGGDYGLPGGAQEAGETLEQALKRECREEIGCEVEIQQLLHVADYFKQRSTEPPSIRQLVEFLFLCRLPDGYEAGNGPRPDKRQIAVEWVALDQLTQIRFQPKGLLPVLDHRHQQSPPVYLGTLD